jgi:hypothetical protein
LNTDDGQNIAKAVTLRGQAYNDWGADDNYLLTYIQSNINTIFDS